MSERTLQKEKKGKRMEKVKRKDQKKWLLILVLLLVAAAAIWRLVSGPETKETEEASMTYQQITAEEAKKRMEQEADALILDVRTREEFETGHIKGAVCLPNEEISGEPEELPDKGQTILVYCRSGNRSKQAAQKLADLGYQQVYEFGGILDWPYQELVE